MMKLRYWRTGALIATITAGLGGWYLAGCPMTLNAEDFGLRATPARGVEETVTGRVKSVLRNDHDDVDGLSLEDGREIHFPPHMGETVTKLASVGDDLKITGNQVTRPRGEVVFEASLIEKGEVSLKIERPRPPRGPKPHHKHGPANGPHGREHETAMNATGVVEEFVTNRHGDVDGLLLADGTEVKLPPHQGEELQSLVKKGEQVKVEGRRHVTPHGDVHLHADRITSVATGASIERDGPGGPQSPRGVRPEAQPAPGPTAKQFEEILSEVRELRRLVEAQQKK